MQKITVFLFILPFLSLLFVLSVDGSGSYRLADDWLFLSDFKPDELANLTSQEKHQLLLKSLHKRRSGDEEIIIRWEILGKAAGIEFCHIADDESTNRENTAIVRAAFECLAKLQYQNQSAQIIEKEVLTDYPTETGDLVKGFSKLCSKMNQALENIKFYAERRDHYRKTDSWQPTKTYLYGIPKNEDEFRKNLTDFANDLHLKKIIALTSFVWYYDDAEKEWPGNQVLMRLAQEPGQLEIVQKILDESILELVPNISNVSPDQIILHPDLARDLDKLGTALNQKLKGKIYANADLKKLVTKWQSPNSPDYIPGL